MTTSIAGDFRTEQFRVFDSAFGPRLLVIPHSRIFAIDPSFGDALRVGDPAATAEVEALAASLEEET